MSAAKESHNFTSIAADFTVSQSAFSTGTGFNVIDFFLSRHKSSNSLNALVVNLQ